MELLKTDKGKIFHPIVSFSGKGELKKVTSTTPVMYIRQVSKYIKELNSPTVLSEEQANKIVAILKQAHIKDPQAAKEHVKRISEMKK